MARKSTILTQRIGNDNLVIGLKAAIGEERISVWEVQFPYYGAKRFPRALQFAVNRVAREAQRYLREAIDRVIDRPVRSPESTTPIRSSILTRGRSLMR